MAAKFLCIKGCGRHTLPGKARCAICMEKQRVAGRQDYRARVSRGQCVYCQDSASIGAFCFTHWFKNIGVPHGLGNKKGIALLRQLWAEQGGRCAVTGELLVPGVNASVDHITPKSKGGVTTKANLRWVLLNVNRAKWDMTHEEFVAICRLVVKTHGVNTPAVIVNTVSAFRSN